MREALATADSDFRPAPRARSSSKTTKSHASSWWQNGRKSKPGRQRLALVAGAILAVAIVGILANALLLQRTRHPAPLLGRAAPAAKPSPAQVSVRPPRPEVRPPAAPDPPQAHERTLPDKSVTEAPIVPKPRQPAPASPTAVKPSDPIGDLLKVSPRDSRPAVPVERRPEGPVVHRPAPAQVRPNAAKEPRAAAAIQPRSAATKQPSGASTAAQPNRRIAAAQRALVKLGFVLEADGVAGAATRKAIERYERDRGLPARGVPSPELLRRLGSESGIPID